MHIMPANATSRRGHVAHEVRRKGDDVSVLHGRFFLNVATATKVDYYSVCVAVAGGQAVPAGEDAVRFW
jgi:hypothetical protein